MEGIAGVRFQEAGPLTWCRADGLGIGVGDYVVVRAERGERLGWVAVAPDQVIAAEPEVLRELEPEAGGNVAPGQVIAAEPEGPLRVIDRIAGAEDVAAWKEGRERALEDLRRAQELATRNDPRVRVASLEYNLAGDHCRITFAASERIAHRWFGEMCGELLGVPVEVSQVSDRDRAKSFGDVGVCGLALCCRTWQTTFPLISMRMAREQDLPPNPTKISGVCGRLLCCLSYEVDEYRRLRGTLPKVGKRVTTPVGRARVIALETLKGRVRMRLDETGEVIEMPADELRSQYGNAVRPEELEERIEEPLRRRDRQRRDALVATLEPVAAPAAQPSRPAGADADGGEAGQAPPSGSGGAARRRRRGRRGGRGRRRRPDGASGAEPPPDGGGGPP